MKNQIEEMVRDFTSVVPRSKSEVRRRIEELLAGQVVELRKKREALAELEHEQWVEWSRNLHSTEKLSPDRIERWKALWKPYEALTEAEKDQDRVWADKVLALLAENKDKKTF